MFLLVMGGTMDAKKSLAACGPYRVDTFLYARVGQLQPTGLSTIRYGLVLVCKYVKGERELWEHPHGLWPLFLTASCSEPSSYLL